MPNFRSDYTENVGPGELFTLGYVQAPPKGAKLHITATGTATLSINGRHNPALSVTLVANEARTIELDKNLDLTSIRVSNETDAPISFRMKIEFPQPNTYERSLKRD